MKYRRVNSDAAIGRQNTVVMTAPARSSISPSVADMLADQLRANQAIHAAARKRPASGPAYVADARACHVSAKEIANCNPNWNDSLMNDPVIVVRNDHVMNDPVIGIWNDSVTNDPVIVKRNRFSRHRYPHWRGRRQAVERAE